MDKPSFTAACDAIWPPKATAHSMMTIWRQRQSLCAWRKLPSRWSVSHTLRATSSTGP